MGKLLSGSMKINKFKEILNRANKFVFIGTTWMTPMIAEIFTSLCFAEKRVVILGDKQPYNIKSYEILNAQDVEVYLDCNGIEPHYKYLITEDEFITTSQNFTRRGFLKQKNLFEYRLSSDEPIVYREVMDFHNKVLLDCVPFSDNIVKKPKSPISDALREGAKALFS